MFNIYPWK